MKFQNQMELREQGETLEIAAYSFSYFFLSDWSAVVLANPKDNIDQFQTFTMTGTMIGNYEKPHKNLIDAYSKPLCL